MKKTLMIIAAAVMAASCFKVDEYTDYGYLSPIEISTLSDTINVRIGSVLNYTGMTVKSDRELTYEWTYGLPSSSSTPEKPAFASKEVISTTPTVDYAFTKVGSYLLRLMVDNGESIVYKYFTLNVNSGFDEGIAILSNDADGNAAVSFVKTLSADDVAAGEQEFYYDIFEGYDIRNGTDLYMSDGSLNLKDKDGNSYPVSYGAFLVATDDGKGTIWHFEPKTTELFTTVELGEYGGTHVKEFGGEYSTTGGFANYLLGADGLCYRYDMQMGNLELLTDLQSLGHMTHAVQARFRGYATSATEVQSWFFNEDSVYVRKSAYPAPKYYSIAGYKTVNIGVQRSGSSTSYLYALFQSRTDPHEILIQNGYYGTWGRATMSAPKAYTVSSLCMDSDSKIVGTLCSSDVYYTYDNAIYRWGLTTAPSTSPAIRVPDGEIIRDIDVNFKGKAKGTSGEDLLYVVTYNPSRNSVHKGSLYIYNFADNTLARSFEGVFDDPVSVIYKYRLN